MKNFEFEFYVLRLAISKKENNCPEKSFFPIHFGTVLIQFADFGSKLSLTFLNKFKFY